MDRRRMFVAGFLVVAVIGAGLAVLSHNQYEKYSLENDTHERFYESCHCFGSLGVMDSYPPQFNCEGISYCRDVNYTRERRLK